MYTYEMVELADKNNKTYENEDMSYSKIKGFHDLEGNVWKIESFYDVGLNYFMHLDEWEEQIPKEMTQEEIEKKLGYPVKLKHWISAKDDVPHGCDNVLVLKRISSKGIPIVSIGFYTSEGWKDRGWLPIEVLYWQELPDKLGVIKLRK